MAERHSDKSPDAFRTISEVADHLDLPQHVLRFWETKFPEIKPVKRAGGRRFYRPEDVDLLRAIRHLLYAEGYTIKGVQKILKDQGARGIQAMGADLLDGRPVDLSAKAPTDLPASGRGGLLGSLLPGRRNKNEARLISEPSTGAYDEAAFQDDSPPAFAQPEPPRRAPRPAAAFERQEPSGLLRDPEFSKPAPRARRETDRMPMDMDPPDAFLPGFEMGERSAEPPLAAPRPRTAPADFDAFEDYPGDRIAREPRVADVRPDPYLRSEPRLEPSAPPPRPAPPPAAEAKPPLRRPSRGPASRIPEPAPLPELEDPLLPFFDDDALTPPENLISEPLNERIRRLKDHGPAPGEDDDVFAPLSESAARMRSAGRPQEEGGRSGGRVGPLTGVFTDDMGAGHEAYPPEPYPEEPYDREAYGHSGEGRYAAEARRQGPPEQYLPPHLRSEPRMTAAPVHAPQPILSRDDMHRLQSALYELGECRRLLSESLRSDES